MSQLSIGAWIPAQLIWTGNMSIVRPLSLVKNLFRKSMTLPFPYKALPHVEGYRGRQILDLEKCTGCPVCSTVCPNQAIELVEFHGKKYPQIHLGKCCFCALCVEYCPRGAIQMTREAMISVMDAGEAVYNPDKLSQPAK